MPDLVVPASSGEAPGSTPVEKAGSLATGVENDESGVALPDIDRVRDRGEALAVTADIAKNTQEKVQKPCGAVVRECLCWVVRGGMLSLKSR